MWGDNMPWDNNNYSTGRRDDYKRPPQNGSFNRQQAGSNTRQAGLNMQQQASSNMQRQAGSHMQQQANSNMQRLAGSFMPQQANMQQQANPYIQQNNPYTQRQTGLNMQQQSGSSLLRQPGSNLLQQTNSKSPQQTGSNPQQQAGQNLPQQIPRQLPDGVQIHPIDASAMSMLRGTGMKPPEHKAEPEIGNKQSLPENTDSLLGISLSEIIQDEHNSSRFYASLADKAPRSVYTDYFKRESNNCVDRVIKLNELYKRQNNTEFIPVESELNVNVEFNTGVSWAVAVESSAVKRFGSLYEKAPDDQSARMIFAHVCGKISHLMMLVLIMQNKDITA